MRYKNRIIFLTRSFSHLFGTLQRIQPIYQQSMLLYRILSISRLIGMLLLLEASACLPIHRRCYRPLPSSILLSCLIKSSLDLRAPSMSLCRLGRMINMYNEPATYTARSMIWATIVSTVG